MILALTGWIPYFQTDRILVSVWNPGSIHNEGVSNFKWRINLQQVKVATFCRRTH